MPSETKKIGELNYYDLGREARLAQANGDVSSGTLRSIGFVEGHIQVGIGNTNVSKLHPGDSIELTDQPPATSDA